MIAEQTLNIVTQTAGTEGKTWQIVGCYFPLTDTTAAIAAVEQALNDNPPNVVLMGDINVDLTDTRDANGKDVDPVLAPFDLKNVNCFFRS